MASKRVLALILVFLVCKLAAGIENLDSCDNRPTDIVFVLDASSSIWPVDFLRQLKFLQNLTSTFNVGPSDSQTRVGLLTFSSRVHVEFNLKDKMNRVELSKAIKKVGHLTGGTQTADAIDYVADNMFLPENGGRQNATHIVIVITDGESYYKDKTAKASKKLREQGATVFAIGVGLRFDLDELISIASRPSETYVIKVLGYRKLNKVQTILSQRTCAVTLPPTTLKTTPTTTPSTTTTTTTTSTTVTTTPPPPTTTTRSTTTIPTTMAPVVTTTRISTTEISEIQADREKLTKSCGGKPADVFFLVDTSSSIRASDFSKQLDFVQNVVDIFDISPERTRVGVSTFSHEYNPIFGLDKYYDKTSLLNAIQAVPYSGGGTDTGNAIKHLHENEFSRKFTRPGVAHVVVVLTDGLSRFPKETAKESAKIKRSGTYVFAVGIGSNIDQEELRNIASEPDSQVDKYAFHVNNFDGLKTLRNILAIKTCEIAELQQDERVCKTTKTSDVTFVYDAAYFGYKMSNMILDIVEQVSMYLATTGGKVQTGLLSNSCLKETVRPLSSLPLELVQDFDGLPALISDLRTSQFLPKNGGRYDSAKIAVLFVEDNLSKSAELEALRSKFRRINLIFVQIGPSNVDGKRQLSKLAAKPHFVVHFNNDVQTTVQHLNTLLCEGV